MNKRVVVWSDMSFLISSISSSLAVGYDVVPAEYGQMTVESVSEMSPDIIILDMPRRLSDVVGLSERLKQDEVLSGTPILLLRGAFEEDESTRHLETAVDATLLKPFTEESLRQKLTQVCEGHPAAEAASVNGVAEAEAYALSEERLDAALEEAIGNLLVGSDESDERELAVDPAELTTVDAELRDIVYTEEGVRREEADELLQASTTAGDKEVLEERGEPQEAMALAEETEGIQDGKLEGETFLDNEIDALVDGILKRVSVELKDSLKQIMRDRIGDMTSRAVKDILPRLSERLVNEMFKTDIKKS